MDQPVRYPMDYQERHALFRCHATAVLSGDAAETARTRRLIYPDHALAHHVFVFALFAACVDDHFGEELDWSELSAFMERLRRAAPGVSPLKTEALIRVCFGEAQLFSEVPQAEHCDSMWAVCRLTLEGERTDGELAALYERAEAFGRDTVRRVFASAHLYGRRDEPEEEPEEEPEAEPEEGRPQEGRPQEDRPQEGRPEGDAA